MLTRTLIAALFLGGLVIPSHADEPREFKQIDLETIAAYEKIGFKYGGFQLMDLDPKSAIDSGRAVFCPGKEAAAKGLPGFRLKRVRDGKLPQLPPVQVPHGIALDHWVTDAGLKELESLTNLILLDLSLAKVTDAGLTELKDLKNLTSLHLSYTLITDKGLKEIKDFKYLTTLRGESSSWVRIPLSPLMETVEKDMPWQNPVRKEILMSEHSAGKKVEPVHDYTDVDRIQAQIRDLTGRDELSIEDVPYLNELGDALSLYLSYCPNDSIKAPAGRLLSYLLSHVKKISAEQTAADTGISIKELEEFLKCHQSPNSDQATILGRYFGVVPDAFLE